MKTINFMGQRRAAAAASIVLVLLSCASFAFRQLNWGLDFTGGTLVEMHYSDAAPLPAIRAALEDGGFEGAVVVSFGSDRDVLIRLPQGYSDKDGARLLALLQAAWRTGGDGGTGGKSASGAAAGDAAGESADGAGGNASGATVGASGSGRDVELRRIEYVGPQVGDELREQGGLAMLLALGLVMLYVAFRFQLKFSVGAVVALIHDVILTLGFFSILGMEFDLTVLAAVLAVIGYSLNDTIVVSDRIRENFRKLRKADPVRVINVSLSEILARTLVTSFTTLLVLTALAVLGGELIRGFAVALIIGVLTGTYSSIYVAANSLLLLGISKEDLMVPVKEGAEQDGMP